MFEIEPLGETSGICECCGKASRSIWGVAHHGQAETVASYFVNWVEGADLAAHPANMDLIIGAWGEGTGAADRIAVSLRYTEAEGGPSVMVIDAKPRNIARNPLVGVALNREEVIGTPLTSQAFALFEAVVLQDRRFKGGRAIDSGLAGPARE